MKKCLNCGYERQPKDEGIVPVTECPQCGIIYDKVGLERVKTDVFSSTESKKKKVIWTAYRKSALVLGILGLALIVFGMDIKKIEIAIIGHLSLTIGLACYAKSKGRSFAWFLWGLFLPAGPIMGYIALAFSKDIIVDDVQSPQSAIGIKSKRHMTLAELLIVILIISLLAYVFFIHPYLKASRQEKLVDIQISQMTSQFHAGMTRDTTAPLLAANDFKLVTYLPSKKDPEHRFVFRRYCCGHMMSNWTLYDVYIEYDDNYQLKFARFTKSYDADGRSHGCITLFEVPAVKDKMYPFSCPADIQEF